MTINITNPEHREALAWACEALREPNKTTQGNGMKAEALLALSDPAQAAEIIRALVERAGVSVIEYGVNSGDPAFPYVSIADRAEPLYVSFGMRRAVVLVARLLALAPGAGADAVLAALRGES